jgi:hypothetical protein
VIHPRAHRAMKITSLSRKATWSERNALDGSPSWSCAFDAAAVSSLSSREAGRKSKTTENAALKDGLLHLPSPRANRQTGFFGSMTSYLPGFKM